jgi:electron transport complex protein RnfG
MNEFWTGAKKASSVTWHYTKEILKATGKALWFLLKALGIGTGRFAMWVYPRLRRGTRTLFRGLAFLWKQDLVRKTATLFLLVAFISGGLAAVDAATSETIAGHRAEAGRRAKLHVMPGAEFTEAALPLSFSDSAVTAFYTAHRDGVLAGFVALVTVDGFSGSIHMTVGLTPGGDLAGATITAMSETINVGSQASYPGWLAQFTGKTAGLRLGSGAGNTIEAISGATITSEAVLSGAVAALGAAAAWRLEAGG